MTGALAEIKLRQPACVSLTTPAQPQAITLVRAMLAGIGELLAWEPELLDDLKTTVSEACNNVVVHAYPEGDGDLSVDVCATAVAVAVRVVDSGVGIDRAPPSPDASLGVGIPLIRALSRAASFGARPQGGTEVRMELVSVAGAGEAAGDPPLQEAWLREVPAGDVAAVVAPLPLVGPVLGRLARAMAISASFSLDRFSDIYLVTDAVAALARRGAAEDRAALGLRAQPRRLELVVGPLSAGAVSAALAEEQEPAPLIALTDSVLPAPCPGLGSAAPGERELLSLVMSEVAA